MGGAATSDWNTVPVERKHIEHIIQSFSEMSSIPATDLTPVGSATNSSIIGDVDLAINQSLHPFGSTCEQLKEKLNGAVVVNRGLQICSCAVPVTIDHDKVNVQVDLIFGPNVNWLKFIFSSHKHSKYKQAVRNILLSSIASAIIRPGHDVVVIDQGEEIARVRRTINFNYGLKKIFQYRPRRRIGTGYVKQFETVTRQEFIQRFPQHRYIKDEEIIDNPSRVIAELLGSGVDICDVEITEDLILCIKNQFSSQDQRKIFNLARERASILNIKLPRELQ